MNNDIFRKPTNYLIINRQKYAQHQVSTGLITLIFYLFIYKEGRQDTTDGEGDQFGIVQEIEIWPLYYQMVHAQTRIPPEEWNT